MQLNPDSQAFSALLAHYEAVRASLVVCGFPGANAVVPRVWNPYSRLWVVFPDVLAAQLVNWSDLGELDAANG